MYIAKYLEKESGPGVPLVRGLSVSKHLQALPSELRAEAPGIRSSSLTVYCGLAGPCDPRAQDVYIEEPKRTCLCFCHFIKLI